MPSSPRVRAWFPTLIYDAALGGAGAAALRRRLLVECRRIRAGDAEGRRWSRANYPGGYTSYTTLPRLHQDVPAFTELSRRIVSHAIVFARRLDMDIRDRPLVMTDCWINMMSRAAVHGLHLHPLSTISGTYYVQTPSGSSELRFEDPRLSRLMAAPPTRADCRPENRHHVFYPARAGRVLLFESWLRHEVSSSVARADRISVSFNLNWKWQ